jgi:hypothetical protein
MDILIAMVSYTYGMLEHIYSKTFFGYFRNFSQKYVVF